MDIALKPREVTFLLSGIAIFLTAAHAGLQIAAFYLGDDFLIMRAPLYEFRLRFDFNQELNFPSVFSTAIIFFCSVLLALIAREKKRTGDRTAFYWWGWAAIFLFLAIDEFASLHEILILPLRHGLNVSGIFYYAWIIPYGVALIIILSVYCNFIISLPGMTRLLFIISGAVYVAGAMGMEFVSGSFAASYNAPERLVERDPIFIAMITIEEMLEMTGIIIFLHALMSYCDTEMKNLYLKINFFSSVGSSSRAVDRYKKDDK